MDDLPDLNELKLKKRESVHEFKMLVGRGFKNYTRNSKSMIMNLVTKAFEKPGEQQKGRQAQNRNDNLAFKLNEVN